MKGRVRLAEGVMLFAGLAAPSLTYPQEKAPIVLPAASYARSENVAAGASACGNGAYGARVILNVPPCRSVRNAVEYEFDAAAGGPHVLAAEYAAVQARPVTIVLNGAVVMTTALRSTTGCWEESCQRWFRQDNIVELRAGTNRLRIERDSYFPHIRTFRLTPLN